LDFARSNALEIAVRGGGHNPAGYCVVDDGLVVDLSRMRNVDVNPDARLAVCEGGATWLDFDAATQRHGLVTPGGVVGSTGVTASPSAAALATSPPNMGSPATT
jgi:FAD/FMN-containing dehydrogenase